MMVCDSEIEGGRTTTYTYVNARAGAGSCAGRRNPEARHCHTERSRSVDWREATNTRHGYTGHEHLDKFALINMNGRVYDPVIGRFLSPDPYIHHPYYSQNFDRYSYVFNNPLKYTDPSGYRDKPLYRHDHQWVRRFNSVLNEVFGGGEYSLDDALNSPYWQLMSGVANGFAEETTGGAGGGAPLGGSAASGPGSGGGGGGAAPLNLGGDGDKSGDNSNEQNGNIKPPRLINKSDKIIWFKPDDDYTDSDGRFYHENEAYPLIPGHFTNVPIDGFTLGDNVYKIANNCTMVVVGNNDYSTFYQTLWGWGQYQIKGGLLETSPGDNWDDLFNKVKKH